MRFLPSWNILSSSSSWRAPRTKIKGIFCRWKPEIHSFFWWNHLRRERTHPRLRGWEGSLERSDSLFSVTLGTPTAPLLAASSSLLPPHSRSCLLDGTRSLLSFRQLLVLPFFQRDGISLEVCLLFLFFLFFKFAA